MQIDILPNSTQDGDKWIPSGLIRFINMPDIQERRESYENGYCNSKDEADQLFVKKSEETYKD